MREIKFRVWDGERMHHPGNEKVFGYHEYMEHEIMQFTGLTDAEGAKIYEADVVAPLGNSKWYEGENWVVSYFPEVGAFRLQPVMHYTPGHHGSLGNTKKFRDNANQDLRAVLHVIGNIYENPEMVE